MEKFFDIVCRLGDLRPGRGRPRRDRQGAQAPRGRPRRRRSTRSRPAPRTSLRHIGIVREFGLNAGRRRQPLPRRHRRASRARQAARARARRLRREVNDGFSHGGAGAAALAEAVVAAADETTDLRLHLPARRADRGQDRGDREARVRGRRGLPSAGRTRKDQGVQQGSGSTACRSAWRRRTCRSPTTRRSRTRRPGSRSAYATCAPTPAPAGSSRSAATCRRCPGSAGRRRHSNVDIDERGRRSASSNGQAAQPLIRARGDLEDLRQERGQGDRHARRRPLARRAAREDGLRRRGARRLVRRATPARCSSSWASPARASRRSCAR